MIGTDITFRIRHADEKAGSTKHNQAADREHIAEITYTPIPYLAESRIF